MNKKKLLALLMALVMTLSLVPVTALAEESVGEGQNPIVGPGPNPNFPSVVNVAQIGNQSYATVKEAIENVADGETINVIADSTANDILYEVTRGALQGKTVTITGSKKLTSTEGNFGFYFGDYDWGNRPTDVINVNGITLAKDGGNYNTLFDGLTANLTDVTITGNGNTALSYANGARGTLTNVTVTNTGSHTDSWRNAALTVQSISSGSELTVESGTYTSANGYAVYIFSSGGIVNIKGGTFEGALCANIDRGTYHNDYNQSIINISGGTFTNVAYNFKCTGTNAAEYAKINITGGTFDADPTPYVLTGYEAVKNGDGTWTVVSANTAVAKIGDVKYATLEAAIAAANPNDTVKLLQNISVSEPIMVGKSITIDGDGKTITSSGNRGFRIDTNNVDVTIKNLTIGGTNLERAIQVDSDKDGVTLTIDNVIATATYYTVNICSDVDSLTMNITNSNLTGWAAINSYCSGSTITVSGSTLHGINKYSSPTNDFATIVFDGGSLVGLSGNSSGTTLTITGCTIIAEELGTNKQYWISYQYGATNNAASVVSVQETSILDAADGADKTSCINIKKKYNVITMALTDEQKAEIEAAGYTVDVNAQDPTKYDISLIPEVYYYWNNGGTDTSFNAPFDNGWLVEGEFIRLEKNVALTENLSNDYSYSLLLNGKTINAGEYTIQIAAGKTVTSDTAGLSFFTAPEGYKIVTGGDETNGYTYTAAAITYVAQIGNDETKQYATLEEALADAPSGATVKLIADIDYSTIYTVRNARDNGNEHVVDLRDLTLDMNGHTISTINATVEFCGNGATITNGTFELVPKNTDGSYKEGSYALIIDNNGDSAGTVLVKDVVCNGGINLCSATVTLDNVTASTTPTKFYAVWAETGATVTILNGTFTDEQTSGRGVLATGQNAEGGAKIYVTGGNYNAGNKVVASAEANSIQITGGIFTKDPTDYVADGYEAVAIDNDRYQVGEIKASGIAAQETVTENYEATYSANKKVVDENDVTLAQDTPITINLKADDSNVSTGNVLNDQYDVSTIVAAIVEAEGAKASTLNVSISVVKDDPDVVEENNKKTVTYEVHPVATITNEDGDTLGTYTISNDQLAVGATFVIKLPVPEALRTNGYVKVTHKLNDGSTVVYGALAYDNDGFITIADVAEFSEFELEIAETFTESASYGFTLALKNKIEIPLYVYNLSGDASNYHVYYSYTDANNQLVEQYVDLSNSAYSVGNGWYRVVVASFSARQLRDEVRVILYTGNDKDNTGNQIYNDTYSIYKYCDNMVNNNGTNTESLKTLCKAMMDYGTAAQWNFGYKTESASDTYYYLNNSQEMGDEYSNSFNTQNSEVFSYIGATLSLKSQTELNFYFTLKSVNINNYTFKVNGVDVDPTPVGSYYKVTASGITAKNLDKQVTVTVTNNNTNEEESYSYSPLNYAYYIQQNSPTDTLKTVCRGLYLYWQAANDYLK